jgi:hypothetical protein
VAEAKERATGGIIPKEAEIFPSERNKQISQDD